MTSRKAIILAAAAFLVLLTGYNAVFKWPAEKQAVAKQLKFIEAIEGRKWGRVHRLTAEDYSDSLGLDRENLQLALKDAGTQFRTRFDLNWEQTDVQRDGDAIVITGNLRIEGEGGPFASMVVVKARPYASKPFTFRWRKTGILPWKWQLESLHHPDARLPDDYKPGDVQRMLRGEF